MTNNISPEILAEIEQLEVAHIEQTAKDLETLVGILRPHLSLLACGGDYSILAQGVVGYDHVAIYVSDDEYSTLKRLLGEGDKTDE